MRAFTVLAALSGLGVLSVPATAKTTEMVLRLQERVPFETLAKSVSDPASPRYQRYYSVDEIRQLAGPTDAEFDALVATLAKQGLHVVSTSPTRLVVTVAGEERSFRS